MVKKSDQENKDGEEILPFHANKIIYSHKTTAIKTAQCYVEQQNIMPDDVLMFKRLLDVA